MVWPSRHRWPLALIGVCLLASPACAQLGRGLAGGPLGGMGGVVSGLPGAVGGTLDRTVGDLHRDVDQTVTDLPATAAGLTRDHLGDLVRAHPKQLELDDNGAAVVRGEVLAISPSPASLDLAAKAGFTVLRENRLDALGLDLVTLSTPKGISAREALKRLRVLDPGGQYDLDHIYAGAGASLAVVGAAGAGGASASGLRLGQLDTGVDQRHPAFAASHIEQRGFAPGGVTPGAHGTAVASLMVGEARGFHGAAPGASVLAADVYGSGPTGGSADAIAGGLAWMAENHIAVINISLVGPPNLTLEAAVRAMVSHGALIVAPVGNDGPAAPPLYPAAYPGVIAVTGVDGRGRTLIEAGRAGHIDFSAPGADLKAARPGGGFAQVRGTSFASPIVAGRLAELMTGQGPSAAAQARAALEAQAHGGIVGLDIASDDRAR